MVVRREGSWLQCVRVPVSSILGVWFVIVEAEAEAVFMQDDDEDVRAGDAVEAPVEAHALPPPPPPPADFFFLPPPRLPPGKNQPIMRTGHG